MPLTTTRTIDAPLETVFQIVSEPQNYPQVFPYISDVKFKEKADGGVDRRSTERNFEVKISMRQINQPYWLLFKEVQHVENESYRLLADANGCRWEISFAVRPVDGNTELLIVLETAPYRFYAKVMLFLFGSYLQQGLQKFADEVKKSCERFNSDSMQLEDENGSNE